MRSPALLAKKHIETRVGVGMTAIDRAARCISLSDGRTLPYSGLAICTGSRLRTLPLAGHDAKGAIGVLGLRSLEDAKAIAAALEQAQNVVIVGGGFIGLEVAAAARKKGSTVTVIEAADRLMSRVVAPLISEFYLKLHQRYGVRVLLNCTVTELITTQGHISAVNTGGANLATYPANLVVVGIGVEANMEAAQAAGIACNKGIVVDACSRTSDPSIVAAGDCTVRPLEDGRLLQLESVQNATEQAKSAAFALLGKERPFTATPWFWSDQYDTKLQIVGIAHAYDHVVTRGDIGEARFSAFYYRDGALIAVDSINQPAEHMTSRRLFERDIALSPEQAADSTFSLNSLLD